MALYDQFKEPLNKETYDYFQNTENLLINLILGQLLEYFSEKGEKSVEKDIFFQNCLKGIFLGFENFEGIILKSELLNNFLKFSQFFLEKLLENENSWPELPFITENNSFYFFRFLGAHLSIYSNIFHNAGKGILIDINLLGKFADVTEIQQQVLSRFSQKIWELDKNDNFFLRLDSLTFCEDLLSFIDSNKNESIQQKNIFLENLIIFICDILENHRIFNFFQQFSMKKVVFLTKIMNNMIKSSIFNEKEQNFAEKILRNLKNENFIKEWQENQTLENSAKIFIFLLGLSEKNFIYFARDFIKEKSNFIQNIFEFLNENFDEYLGIRFLREFLKEDKNLQGILVKNLWNYEGSVFDKKSFKSLILNAKNEKKVMINFKNFEKLDYLVSYKNETYLLKIGEYLNAFETNLKDKFNKRIYDFLENIHKNENYFNFGKYELRLFKKITKIDKENENEYLKILLEKSEKYNFKDNENELNEIKIFLRFYEIFNNVKENLIIHKICSINGILIFNPPSLVKKFNDNFFEFIFEKKFRVENYYIVKNFLEIFKNNKTAFVLFLMKANKELTQDFLISLSNFCFL